MTTHVLNVCSEGVIRSLRNQFTRSTTFLSEALQNARRAGATEVQVTWDGSRRLMTITDDGQGIRSFDALFTVGKSGWDAEVVAQECPFGVGFMAAVLASDHIQIRSLNQQVSFETRALLNFEQIQVATTEGAGARGTELTLTLRPGLLQPTHGRLAQDADWDSLLAEMGKGFSIPVSINGQPIPRPHAVASGRAFIATEVGQVSLQGWEECEPEDLDHLPHLYYQGLPLHRESRYGHNSRSILHVDQQRFRVRMPDRDVLIDAEEQKHRILNVLRDLWRKRLIERYGQMDRKDFVERYWRLCARLNLPELLRDAPLSATMLRRYTTPIDLVDDDHPELQEWGRAPLPDRNAIFIESLTGEYYGDSADPPGPFASVYAIARGIPVLDGSVPSCHWAQQRVVDLLDKELAIAYSLNGPTRAAQFCGEFVSCKIVVCDSVVICFNPTSLCNVPANLRAHLVPVTVDDQAFYDAERETLIVPSKARWAGGAVNQISSYRDEFEVFQEVEYERDQEGISDLVESLRSSSPHAYLESLLQRLVPDPELLGNTEFTVRYDSTRRRLVVGRAQA